MVTYFADNLQIVNLLMVKCECIVITGTIVFDFMDGLSVLNKFAKMHMMISKFQNYVLFQVCSAILCIR